MLKNLCLAACLSAVPFAASAKDAPPAGKGGSQVDPAKLDEAKKLVSSATYKHARDDADVKKLGEAEFKARTETELALKRQDKEFAEIHDAYEKAREKSKANSLDSKLRDAYYAEQAKMIVILEAKAERKSEMRAQLKQWRKAKDAKDDKVAEVIDKASPDEAKAFRAALKLIRGARK